MRSKKPKKVWIIIDEVSLEVWDGGKWNFDAKSVHFFTTEKSAKTALDKGLHKKLCARILEYTPPEK